MELDQTPTGGLRERGKAVRRARILAAAREVFSAKGYEAASTREIAIRAEVGTGTLFDYAPDKRALLMMVFYEDLERLTLEAAATLDSRAPLLDQLMHMLAPRYALWGFDRALSRYAVRETFALMAQSGDGARSSSSAFASRRPLLSGKLAEMVADQQRRGILNSAFGPADFARLFMDIYLNESREWVQEDATDLNAGLDRLRTMLTIALNGMLA